MNLLRRISEWFTYQPQRPAPKRKVKAIPKIVDNKRVIKKRKS